MAIDAKGNSHKAAGRPDGGQFDRRTGQGSDDDLDFGAVPADLDEEDPIAVARYLDSLDPGVRFLLSDGARALEAHTLDDPDWCDAHAEELMAAVPDIGSGALTGVIASASTVRI